MRFLVAAARKDLLRLIRDWPALLLWVGIPLAIGGIMVVMFGGDSRPTARLLVDDRDGTIASRLLTGVFSQGPLADVVEVEPVDPAEGERRIGRGEASALLVIPEGFGAAALKGEPAALRLVTNPAQVVLPGILEGTLDTALEAAEVLRRLLGGPIDAIVDRAGAGGAPSDSLVASVSTRVNRAVDDASTWLLPPRIDLETVALDEGESFDFARAFFPGMLILGILFMATGLSSDVWSERTQGTLRRAISTPRGAATIVAGKWIAGAVALAAVAAIGVAAGAGLFGLEAAHPLLAVAWTTLAGVALLALFTTVQLLARSETAGNVLVGAVTLPLAMLGGSFFPFEAMPGWMVSIGRATPNGFALARLRSILDGAPEPGPLAAAAAGAAVLVAVLGLVTARGLRRFAA